MTSTWASSQDQGAATFDSAWLWDDFFSTADASGTGLMLTPLTLGTNHQPQIELASSRVNGTRSRCSAPQAPTPTGVGDYAMRMVYALGDLGAGQSKTVKFEYRHM